jgi:hypothetical protein
MHGDNNAHSKTERLTGIYQNLFVNLDKCRSIKKENFKNIILII